MNMDIGARTGGGAVIEWVSVLLTMNVTSSIPSFKGERACASAD